MPATIRNLVTAAFRELGVAPLSGDLPAPLASLGLSTLNRVLDSWNAQHPAAFADLYSTFTLSANTNPHTIGPSGATWTLTQRPVEILSLSVSPDGTVWVPIRLITREEYDAHTVPGLTSAYPSEAFYNPTWPSGSLYLWPVPTSAYSVELVSRRVLASVALSDAWSFPPGYEDALQKTLKEELTTMPMFSSSASQEQKDAARVARAVIFDGNETTPKLVTADHGMGPRRGVFDWRSGLIR